MTQLTIPENQSKIEAAFWKFHCEHPEVYRELVRLAREMVSRGERFGIATIYEVLRWQRSGVVALGTGRPAPKLNNNFRAYYARLMMKREPDLEGVFNVRELAVPSHRVP